MAQVAGMLFELLIFAAIVVGGVAIARGARGVRGDLRRELDEDSAREALASREGWRFLRCSPAEGLPRQRSQWCAEGSSELLGSWRMDFEFSRSGHDGNPARFSLDACCHGRSLPRIAYVPEPLRNGLSGAAARAFRELAHGSPDPRWRAARSTLDDLLAEGCAQQVGGEPAFLWLSHNGAHSRSLAADEALNDALQGLRSALPPYFVLDARTGGPFVLVSGPEHGLRLDSMTAFVSAAAMGEAVAALEMLVRRLNAVVA
jgi:hypothetical protein